MSKRIGLIVDGDGDYAVFKRRFPHDFKILKTDGPRGPTAAVDDIASRSRKQISILKAFGCKRILVVLDFERRGIGYNHFFGILKRAFGNAVWGVPVSVAVPNRMIENWYLADIEFLSKKKAFLRNNIKQKNYEGTNGKEVLKSYFVRKIKYRETKHGPQLFAILRFNVARKNSPSFNQFLQILRRHITDN